MFELGYILQMENPKLREAKKFIHHLGNFILAFKLRTLILNHHVIVPLLFFLGIFSLILLKCYF